MEILSLYKPDETIIVVLGLSVKYMTVTSQVIETGSFPGNRDH